MNEGTVQAWAKKRGYRVAVGGVSLLKDVRDSLRRRTVRPWTAPWRNFGSWA